MVDICFFSLLMKADLETQKAVGLGVRFCSSHVRTLIIKTVEMLRMVIKIIMMTLMIGEVFFFFNLHLVSDSFFFLFWPQSKYFTVRFVIFKQLCSSTDLLSRDTTWRETQNLPSVYTLSILVCSRRRKTSHQEQCRRPFCRQRFRPELKPGISTLNVKFLLCVCEPKD